MLDAAKIDGIVVAYEDIQEHVSHLTSIREFPQPLRVGETKWLPCPTIYARDLQNLDLSP